MPYNPTGIWQMNHDGHDGTLTIQPGDQALNAVEGNCEYLTYQYNATYSSSDGTFQNLPVVFGLGGKDTNRKLGEPCPYSDHLVQFTIAFPGAPPQQFEGYFFTRGAAHMAGFTWWQGIPFGWYAQK